MVTKRYVSDQTMVTNLIILMEFIGVIFDLLTCVLTFFRCGHCKKLAPEFEKAATTLKENDPPVGLAEVTQTVKCLSFSCLIAK